jgi:hypothetical protein
MAYQRQGDSQNLPGGVIKATFIGKSTDTKPTGEGLARPLATGSVCYEMDTQRTFMFDADAPTGTDPWLAQ